MTPTEPLLKSAARGKLVTPTEPLVMDEETEPNAINRTFVEDSMRSQSENQMLEMTAQRSEQQDEQHIETAAALSFVYTKRRIRNWSAKYQR